MAATSADPGRIFISYRREDSAFPAGWLYDRLCVRFGSDYVFKDVDSIDPGDDFLRVIEDAVGSCQVLLALIGDHWLDITDPTGHRRLDDPNDFVRLEIEAALRRDVRVIPLLVGRAPLPSSEQLPDSLRGLIRRHAIELSPNRFEPDVGRLVRIIDKTLAAVGEGPADAHTPVDRTSRWQGPPAEGHGNLLADPQWLDAQDAYWNKRWVDAVDRFEALQGRYPGEDRVETRLTEARRQRDIDAWSSKAESAAVDGDWDTVVTALENLTGLDPNYPDVAARLEQARSAQRRKALVDEMTALHQAGRWEAVVAAAQELARLDPANPDPGGIVSDAKTKIRDAELADRYAQAINHLDQEEWQQAADLFTAIEQEQPGYREAATLITTAQRQRDLAGWSDQAAAAGQDDWDAVVPVLEKICAVDPTYQDAGARLEKARSAKRLRTLVDEMTALHQAGRWDAVVAAADELAQLDPHHPDPDGIVSKARAKLREAAQRIADLQDKLRGYATADNWQAVIEVNDELAALDPEAADPDGLATQARSALRAQAEATESEERYTQARAAEDAGNWTTYTPWIQRVGAWIIDIIPLVVVFGVEYGILSGTMDIAPTCTAHYGGYCPDTTEITNSTTEITNIGVSILVGTSLLVLVYLIWNYGYRQGTTGSSIGKSVLKFKVVSEKTGQPIGFGMSVVRQIAHVVDTVICYIGYLFPLWDNKRQTLADKIMSTVCVPI